MQKIDPRKEMKVVYKPSARSGETENDHPRQPFKE
jgi:hypothetical protein